MNAKQKDIDEGFWVFISHSNKDFEQVRLVRNALEEEGYRPILLYLKCMEDENEINDLLKREIDSRKRFILCDSINAQQSRFVQSEVKYIRSKKRMYEVINVNQIDVDNPDIKRMVTSFIKPFKERTTVFLNYSMKNRELASSLEEALTLAGFKVFDFKRDIPIGGNFHDTIVNQIRETLENGYFISLLTPDSISSPFAQKELQYAMSINPKRVFPVICEDMKELPHMLRFELSDIQMYDVSHKSTLMDKAQSIADGLLDFDMRNNN